MPVWLQVVLTIVAPVSGLVGVAVGASMTHRSADRQWRLTAKRELYVRLAQASEDVRSCVLEAVQTEGIFEGRWIEDGPVKSRYADALKRFFAGMTEAAIVAEPSVYDALRRHAALVVSVVAGPLDPEDPAGSFMAAFETLRGSSNAALDAMRLDLGFRDAQLHSGWRDIGPLPTRYPSG